jgi:hypothetical protein
MTLQGRRSNICNEDRATLESDPSALQGHRQTAAPAFSPVGTPGCGCFFVSRWNRPDCLAPKANTPGPGGAEPSSDHEENWQNWQHAEDMSGDL